MSSSDQEDTSSSQPPQVAAAAAAAAAENEGEEEQAKPQVDNDRLTIGLRDQHGEQIQFKIKYTTKLYKVYNSYAQQKGVQLSSVRFLFDGDRLDIEDKTQTPKMLEMEDGDQIDVMLAQTGGI